RTTHRPHLRPGKHPPHTVLVQLHPDSFSHRSALRPVKIHDNAPLRSAGEVGVVVPHAHVADRVPFKVVEHNPVIRARARTLDRREHLHAPDDRVAVCLERFRQPRLAARRDPINGPRLVLPRKRRVAVTVRLTLDPVTDSERLSNATHHAPSKIGNPAISAPHEHHFPVNQSEHHGRWSVAPAGATPILNACPPRGASGGRRASRSSSSSPRAPGLSPPNVLVLLPENWPVVSCPDTLRCPDGLRNTRVTIADTTSTTVSAKSGS